MADGPLPVGTTLQDRYEILAELGTGSFGRVYRARQLSTGREVAIKTLRLWDTDTAAAIRVYTKRFEREMQLCAALSHPNIVRLMDSGKFDDGSLYAVFEFVPGQNLAELLEAEGPLQLSETVNLMTQVLDAISCAHAQGVVHRDLKPSNIMVTRTGVRRNALVLDFGLGGFSRVGSSGDLSRLTGKGEMVGTPSYAAPEQVRGEQPTPLSDLYSWGLTFIECLTGDVVVSGETGYDILMKQLGTQPIAIPAEVRDPRLRRLLQTVTSKDVERRNVTIASVLESLASIERSLGAAPATSDLPTTERGGERRQLTLVSCRTVARHADGRALDLEDLDHVLHAQQALCARLVAAHGGVVVGRTGDRVLMAFGYPRAHENDARRAMRAALQIVAASRDTQASPDGQPTIGVHIGMHSARVIVREPSDGSAAGLEIIGGSVPLVARLDEAAPAGGIVLTIDTGRLLHGETPVEPAGELALPDGARMVVLRVAGREIRTATAHSLLRVDSPLVGRHAELTQLLAIWEDVERATPSVVVLTGEPGIGKSRLAREVRNRLPPDAWLECQCDAESGASPLQPIVSMLSTMPEPIERLLERHGLDVSQTLPLFADLLSAPLPAGIVPLRLAPERQKELTLSAIVTLLFRMSRTRPLLFAVEDLHWADPTTLELLTTLVGATRAARIDGSAEPCRLGVLLTARPEFSPPWSLSDMQAIALDRLDRASVDALVRADFGRDAVLPAGFVEHIAARTDGVPLFVEELGRVMRDRMLGGGRAKGPWDTDVPGTLLELLTARLDRLSASARETASIAAALGREFPYELLAAVTPKTEWSMREDLRELVEARLVYPRRNPPTETYVFKHSLVRDAAYEGMVRSTRRRVHVRIAAILQARFPEIAHQQPGLLAHHLEAADDLPAALEWWHRAGDRALRRAAYAEATQQLEHALEVLPRLPDTIERRRLEVQLLTTLGTVQFSTRGYSAPEVEQTFARAHTLCAGLGQEVDPRVLSGVIGVHINRGNREATDALLPQFAQLAASSEGVAAVTGLTTLGINAFWRGMHVPARDYLARACRAYRGDEFQRYAREYGYDGGIFSYAYVGWNLWALGYPAQALAAHRELMMLAESSFDPFSLPLALAFGVALAHSRREPDEMLAQAEQLSAVAAEQKLYFWLTIGHFGRGGALTLRGNPAEGIPHIRLGLDLARAIGAMTLYGYYLSFLAAAYAATGQLDEGLAVVDEGLEICTRALARYHEPELLRLKGALLQHRDPDEAERWLRRSLAIARASGARAWELRAATTLAALLRDAGRAVEGRSLLAGSYAGFTEGFELPDLRDAQALLAQLP